MMVQGYSSQLGIPHNTAKQLSRLMCRRLVRNLNMSTVFPRIDATAFIYFIVQFGAATIRGRRLFEGGVYYFGKYARAT